jgi:hypothetical protein
VDALRRQSMVVWRKLAGLDARIIDGVLAIALSSGGATQQLLEGTATRQSLISAIGIGLPLAWRRRYPLAMYLTQSGSAVRRRPQIASERRGASGLNRLDHAT